MAEMRLSEKGFVVQDEEAGITPMTVVPASLFDHGHLHVQQTTASIELCWQKTDSTGARELLLAYRTDQSDLAANAARVVTDRISIYQTWSPSWTNKRVRTSFPYTMGIGVIAVGMLVLLAAFVGRDLISGLRDRSVGPVVAATGPLVESAQPAGSGPVAPSGTPSLPVLPAAPVAKKSAALPSAEEMQRNQALAMQKIEAAVEKVRQEQYGQAGQGAPAAPSAGGPVRTGEFVTLAE